MYLILDYKLSIYLTFVQTFYKIISQTWQRVDHKSYIADESCYTLYGPTFLFLFYWHSEGYVFVSDSHARHSYCLLSSSASHNCNRFESPSLLLSLSLSVSSILWNFVLQIWQNCLLLFDLISSSITGGTFFSHGWLFLLHAFLNQHRTFQCSHHHCRNDVCFWCYQIKNAWIMNSHTTYASLSYCGRFFWVTIRCMNFFKQWFFCQHR